ncbi:hypothetical protein [Actinospica sp.]|uniref:hypothetical protein n=1 Tax=Actinospica sp. TaxID=1872142 RepID=UPI002B7AE35C|nr:hypothetical protein [Actinospica sp.]HWG22807.1 hypothetical protein [Actinospica sp.]
MGIETKAAISATDRVPPLEARAPKLAILAAAVVGTWLAVVLVSKHESAATVYLTDAARTRYLTVHVIGFCIGLGTVLAVDGVFLTSLFGWTSIGRAARFALYADWLIWLGFVLVCLSGAFLQPDFGNGWVVANFFVVLALGVNAVHARDVLDHVRAVPKGARVSTLPRPLLVRAVTSAVLSQSLWWTSMAIGFFTRLR